MLRRTIGGARVKSAMAAAVAVAVAAAVGLVRRPLSADWE
jgi:hypothetical protein